MIGEGESIGDLVALRGPVMPVSAVIHSTSGKLP